MPKYGDHNIKVEPETEAQQNKCDQNIGSSSESERGSLSQSDRKRSGSWFVKMFNFKNMKHYMTGENFDIFCRRYKQFILLNKLHDPDLYLHFLQMLDDKTYQKLVEVELKTAEKKDAVLFCQRYLDVYYPQSTKYCLQNELMDCKQDEDENIDDYSLRLKEKARIAFLENNIRETNCLIAFQNGIRNAKIKRKLIEAGCSTLNEAVKMAIRLEQVDKLLSNISDQKAGLDEKVSSEPQQKHSRYRNCSKFVGKSYHYKTRKVSEFDGTYSNKKHFVRKLNGNCYICDKYGHYSYDCWYNPRNKVNFGYTHKTTNLNYTQKYENRVLRRNNKLVLQELPSENKPKFVIARGTCYSVPVDLFVDTGATTSLVSYRLIDQLKLTENVQSTNIKITGLDNKLVPMVGKIKLELKFANTKIVRMFTVSKHIQNSFLIGMDVLSDINAVINVRNKTISTPFGVEKFIQQPLSLNHSRRIKCGRTVKIDPNTVCYITGDIGQKRETRSFEGIIEPHFKMAAENGIFVAKSMVYSENNKIPVQCMNVTEKPVTIYKGQLLGYMEPFHGFQIGSSEEESVRTALHNPYDASMNIPRFYNDEDRRKKDEKWENVDELINVLEIDKANVSEKCKSEIKDLVREYSHCFSRDEYDVGKCTFYKAEIKLKRDAEPKWIPTRLVPYRQQPFMEEQINKRMKNGQIEYCPHSYWNTNVFLVSKKGKNVDSCGNSNSNNSKNSNSGNSWRIVQDARPVNVMSLPDSFEAKKINHLLDSMGNCRIFSSFDFTSSFNNLELTEESKHITAFTYNGRQYQWNRMIMGHLASSSQWSRMFSQLFARVPFENLEFYIDDLLVASRDEQEHIRRLEFVLKRLSWAGLKLNGRKTKFARAETTFCGHKLSRDGVRVDPDKLKPILNLQAPSSVKKLQSFLGMVNYQRAFIKNYAMITKPLYELLKKGREFNWTRECQKSFEQLKKSLTGSPCLGLPDITDKLSSYELAVDASKNGFGATLSQIVNEKRRIISYYSKSVPPHQRRFGATKLEFLALYNACMHFKNYLIGCECVTVKTDCKSLLNLDTIFAKGNAYMQRRMADLAGFNLKIVHVSGKSNVIPDFLSRYPFEKKNRSTQTDQIYFPNKVLSVENENCNESSCDSETLTNEVSMNNIINTLQTAQKVDMKTPVTYDEIREETENDITLSKVKNWLLAGAKPEKLPGRNCTRELQHYYTKFELLTLKDGLIWYTSMNKNKPSESKKVVVVPYSLTERLLYSYHDSLQNAHSGVEISLATCQERYYYYKMKKDFKLYIAACLICNRNKQPKAYLRAKLKSVVYHNFNDAICIDHLEPSKTATQRRNTALLTIVDCATNYTVCVPVKSQSAPETVKKLIEAWVCRFGVPLAVHTDRHANFCSKTFSAVMGIYDVNLSHSTPYHSQGNGRAEAMNKRINTAMRVSLTDDQFKNYDLWIKYIMFTLNSMKSNRTGYSPNFLVFGRSLNMPRDLLMTEDSRIDEFAKDIGPDESRKMQAYQMYRQVADVSRKVFRNSKKQADYSARQYNKKVKGPFFEVGDWCFLLVNVKKHKYSDMWSGPYKVIKKINDWNYVIEIDDAFQKLVSITKMKHYDVKNNKYSQAAIEKMQKNKRTKKVVGSKAVKEKQHKGRDDSADNREIVPWISIRRGGNIVRPRELFGSGTPVSEGSHDTTRDTQSAEGQIIDDMSTTNASTAGTDDQGVREQESREIAGSSNSPRNEPRGSGEPRDPIPAENVPRTQPSSSTETQGTRRSKRQKKPVELFGEALPWKLVRRR